MTEEKKPTAPAPAADNKATAVPKITRRRFTKAGVAAPLIMTLGTRPVWGQCLTVSGIQSGNTSDADDPKRHLAHGSEGYPASYWICHPSEWLRGKTYEICATEGAPAGDVTIYQPSLTGQDALWGGLIGGDSDSSEIAAAKINAMVLDDFGYSVDEIDGFIASADDTTHLIAFLSCLNGRTQPVPTCPEPKDGISKVKLTEGDTTKCFEVDSSFVFYEVGDTRFGVGEVSEIVCPTECNPPALEVAETTANVDQPPTE